MERRFSGREFVAYMTILMNFGGLVWGAAKMSSALESLSVRLDKLEAVANSFVAISGRIEVINYRVCLLEVPANQRGSCRQ